MKVLRGLLISTGLGVLAVLGLVELVLRRRDDPPSGTQHDENVVAQWGPPVSGGLMRARLVVGVVGVALAGYGGYLVLRTVPWTSYLAIAIWLAAAVILHDAVLVPAVSVLREVTVRGGRRLGAGSLAVIEGAFVVGGVLTLVVVPEIWAKQLGPLNPSVLPGSYGRALLVTWLVLIAVAACAVTALALLARLRAKSQLEPAS